MNASSTEDLSHLSHGARSLQWLLANLVDEVPGVHSVAVISSDGLLLSSSAAEGTAGPSGAAGDGGGKAGTGAGSEAKSPTAPVPEQRKPQASAGRPAKKGGDLATVVSGLASLTDGAARLMDAGTVKQSVIAMENGCLFVMAISDGSLLGVHASPECDMSVVAYHMALFVGRAGHVLTPELRSELSKARTPGTSDESEH